MKLLHSMLIAFATYSRIPMPRADWSEENMRYSMCFFPLVGLAVGAVLCGWIYLCEWAQLGGFLKGTVAAAIPLLVTGGIHMDGLMDTCDALASWQSKERRLEILKDSHIGAFAAIGCCMYLLVQAGVLSEATGQDALLVALGCVASRALSALALAFFRNARGEGMLHSFSHSANRRAVVIAMTAYLLLCAVIGLWLGGWRMLAALVVAGGVFGWYRRMAYKQFGGITGDLAGFFLQICELAMAFAIVLLGRIL